MEAVKSISVGACERVLDFVDDHPYLCAGVASVIVVSKVSRYLASRIPNETIIEVDLDKMQIIHREIGSWNQFFAAEMNILPIHELLSLIEQATQHPKVRGLYVRMGTKPQGVGPATVNEFRAAVQKFRQAGKTAILFAETIGSLENALAAYWFATCFDKIFVSPAGDVAVVELVAEAPFVKEMLSKIGVLPQISARKQYKNAPNMFTEDHFTVAHKEATVRLLTALKAQIRSDIATGRKTSESTVDQWIADGPYGAQQALDKHLIDGVIFHQELRPKLAELFNLKAPKLLYLHKFSMRVGPNPRLAKGKHQVAFISCSGAVHSGPSERDWSGGLTSIGSDTVCRAIAAAVQSPAKVILIFVSSRGGSYLACAHINQAVISAKRAGKKVVGCIGDVGASAGYFMLAHADRIICSPTTITGSIGAFAGKFALREMWNKIGVAWDFAAPNALDAAAASSPPVPSDAPSESKVGDPNQRQPDEQPQREQDPTKTNGQIFSWVDKYSEADQKKLDDMLDRIYGEFVQQVARGRNLTVEQVEAVAKGRVWLGVDALRHKLVDGLGGLSQAIAVAKELAGIAESDSISLVSYPRPKTFATIAKGGADSSDDVNADCGSVGAPLSGMFSATIEFMSMCAQLRQRLLYQHDPATRTLRSLLAVDAGGAMAGGSSIWSANESAQLTSCDVDHAAALMM